MSVQYSPPSQRRDRARRTRELCSLYVRNWTASGQARFVPISFQSVYCVAQSKAMAEFWGDTSTRVFRGTERGGDGETMLSGLSLEEDKVEDEEARLAAAGIYKEITIDDYPHVLEDYDEDELPF